MVTTLSRKDRLFTAFNAFVGICILVLVAYPLIFILSASFSNPSEVAAGHVRLWPVKPSLMGYRAVFEHQNVMKGFMNSGIYLVLGTLCSVTATLFAAYPLSRKDFPGRKFFTFLFTFTMIFSGGIIPTYLVVRSFGLVDTRAAMILPTMVGVWNVIVARTYFSTTIPGDLLDASRIDGASDFLFFFKIVLPLSGPIVAVLGLFYAVEYWNSFFNALLYLNEPDLFPLQLVLRNILLSSEIQQNELIMNVEEIAMRQGLHDLLKYALIVVSSVPVLAIYPFVQKHFVKGVMVGSLKG
ncbi:MAG: carbohydrate ABC transporter permease [Spirochaetales bacterium]|nr:carbohydrate ABC transporter permease [Spirochaetales bacterium]